MPSLPRSVRGPSVTGEAERHAIRFTPAQGNLFESGAGPKYLAAVTSRGGTSAELVRWHWEKAGTIEHVHHVVKNELGGGVLPCGRFGANEAWFRLALLTYNVLRALKAIALPPASWLRLWRGPPD